jgi:hypothetical protein
LTYGTFETVQDIGECEHPRTAFGSRHRSSGLQIVAEIIHGQTLPVEQVFLGIHSGDRNVTHECRSVATYNPDAEIIATTHESIE